MEYRGDDHIRKQVPDLRPPEKYDCHIKIRYSAYFFIHYDKQFLRQAAARLVYSRITAYGVWSDGVFYDPDYPQKVAPILLLPEIRGRLCCLQKLQSH